MSVPLQTTLGVLFLILQVSSLLGYLRQFDYFVLPQECSHILCAHNPSTTGSASNHTLLTNENRQNFPKRNILKIFLQLKRTSNHTLLTNKNRQTFPKQKSKTLYYPPPLPPRCTKYSSLYVCRIY